MLKQVLFSFQSQDGYLGAVFGGNQRWRKDFGGRNSSAFVTAKNDAEFVSRNYKMQSGNGCEGVSSSNHESQTEV